MGSERTGRQIGFDALRIIAAFLVICQHVEYYWGDVIIRPISRIAVFLFFLISGYFLWDEDTNLIRNRCHKSISKLCKIYLWAILIYGIEALCVAIHTGTYDVFHVGLWKIFVFVTACTSPLFPYGYHLWFLIALIESLVVIWVISKKYNLYTNKYSGELCIVFSIIGVWVNHYIVTMPMQKIILLAMPTIILGGVIRRSEIKESKILMALLICIFSMASVYESRYWTNNYCYSTIPLSVILFMIFKGVSNGRLLTSMAKIGAKYSLGIYIIHPLLIDALKYSEFSTNTIIINPVFVLVLSFVVVLLYYLFVSHVSKHIISVFGEK